jgi:hypothetical protein
MSFHYNPKTSIMLQPKLSTTTVGRRSPNNLIIFSVGSNPEPNQTFLDFYSDSPIFDSYSYRPIPFDPLQM